MRSVLSVLSVLCYAGASAAAWSCGDSVSIAELEVTAHALAKATAVALSYAYSSCEVDDGWACSSAGTEIKQTATAVAQAYADLWAGAYTCEDTCTVEADAVVEAVGSVLVTAASDAMAEGCSGV